MSFLRVAGVRKTFNRAPLSSGNPEDWRMVAIEELTFEVSKGEIFTILGPSGCGKTTLLRIIAGLTDPTSGHVTLDGRSITGPGPDRAIVFQNYPSFPWLNVLDNVAFGLRFSGLSKSVAARTASSFVERVGLHGFERAYIQELSGGMQQRVALARSLACKARVVLLDEPFGALDFITKEQLHRLVVDLRVQEQITFVMVTHDIDEALSIADRVIVLTKRPACIAQILVLNDKGMKRDNLDNRDLIRSSIQKILRDEER